MGAFIELQGVSKRFGATTVVRPTDLTLHKGEVFSLLGPSGCGKTTLLRMLAGFLAPDTGRILVNGQDLTGVPPNRRPINTVFQSYALFPHLTIRENIAFGLRVAKRPKAEIAREVDRMLDLIQMADHAEKRPGAISGGQKQRVAIARALINKPQLLLLDEPLAALDLKLRQRMLLELDRIHDEVGITFLYVTHDQGEAMSLSDRLAVMQAGVIEQIGTPAEIYETPRSRFVADFIGDTNLLSGTVSGATGENYLRLAFPGLPHVRFGLEQTESEGPELIAWKDRALSPGSPVVLSLRPEKVSIAREPPPRMHEHNAVPGVVEDLIYMGARTQFRVRTAADQVLVVSQQHNRFLLDLEPIRWEERVWLSWHANDGFLIAEESGGPE
jgi:spermidine/putrescine transport system ATP-binding protein